jgi:hypothetical protein
VSTYAIPRRGISIGGPQRRSKLDDLITWAFGVATVVTNKGKAMFADRLRTSPGKYTTSPKFLALGVGAHAAERTAVAADTALSNEKETRTSGTESTITTTQTEDTYQVTGTQTATAERAVDECGLFDASSTGNMFTSATIATDTLLNEDSITWTWKVQQS